MFSLPESIASRVAWGVACLALLTLLSCSSHEPELAVISLGDTPVRLDCDSGVGVYSVDPAQVSLVSTDIPVDLLQAGTIVSGRLLHVELLWMPQPGKSPIVPEATNACIRLLVFSEGEVGVYGGGGFAWPIGRPGEPEFALDIVGSNLTMLASTSGFHDLLSPAMLTGILRANLDSVQTRKTRRAASQVLTNSLREVRWVGAPGSSTIPQQALVQSIASALSGEPVDDIE
ncbi:MAG: hypothetical protein EXS00_01965 [Phycisphaerales bacterium]|nr:hypothetical protein [Phycisphaerales bacterium]